MSRGNGNSGGIIGAIVAGIAVLAALYISVNRFFFA